MKYDKPVWQIMHACADVMPDNFRYEDVREWFQLYYPDVNEATIRAHLIGLTEGGRAKHVQFAQRSPVFRRVARGEYTSIPVLERGEHPNLEAPSASRIKMVTESRDAAARSLSDRGDDVRESDPATPPRVLGAPADDLAHASEPHAPDIILLGSVGERVNVPAPAKEVFREVSFQLGRLDAERSGSEWFVLSAEHGLLAPNEWMSPDARTLGDMVPAYRVTWAVWVVTRLESLAGALDGLFVRVDAPAEFMAPLYASLRDAGAIVSSGDVAMTSEVSASPASPSKSGKDAAEQLLEAVVMAKRSATPAADNRASDATVLAIDPGSAVSLQLADSREAVSAADVSSLPDSPGLYGWFVDPIGARELNRSLMLPVRAGLIFVGQVGGSSWQSLADPVLNLRDHVERIQLHGRARASTFRMTLATVLRDHLRMTSIDDPILTNWMIEHLSISAWASDNFGELRELEQIVISELDPPLNVDHLPANEYRARLSQMRSAFA